MTGNRVEGTLAAGTEREALASLSAKDLFPLQVATSEKSTPATRSPKVKARVMATTYNQMSALLRSGVPLLRSLEVIAWELAQRNELTEALESVRESRSQEMMRRLAARFDLDVGAFLASVGPMFALLGAAANWTISGRA